MSSCPDDAANRVPRAKEQNSSTWSGAMSKSVRTEGYRPSKLMLQADGYRLVPDPTELDGGIERSDSVGLHRRVAADQVPGCVVLHVVESGRAHAQRGQALAVGNDFQAISELSRLAYSDRVDEPAQLAFWRSAREQ